MSPSAVPNKTHYPSPDTAVQQWHNWVDAAEHSVILDGGLGELVQKRGNDILSGSLWSGQLIKTNPNELKNVADEWLKAGAEIICTATYQVSIEVLASEFNLTHEQAETYVQQHCNQICDSAESFWNDNSHNNNNKDNTDEQQTATLPLVSDNRRKPLVALSLGPLSAILPDCDEFSSNYPSDVTLESLKTFHGNRVSSFLGPDYFNLNNSTNKKPKVSVLAFETVGACTEALAISQVMNSHRISLPFWLSLQCRDDQTLASGDSLSKCVHDVLSASQSSQRLIAIGVNCICVTIIETLTKAIAKQVDQFMSTCENPWKVIIIAYPNSGEVWTERSWTWDTGTDARIQSPLLEDDWAKVVFSTNAKIVGGCCRTGPQHIAALRRVALAAQETN